MTDERLRRLERDAHAGDEGARRRLRWEAIRATPSDVEPLLPDLRLDAWNALAPDDRDEVAALFARVLAARGRPMELVDVLSFGPEGDQPIARYHDRATDLLFCLVPGGRFAPGITEAQVEALVALGQFDASDLPDEARRRAERDVEPFLMAAAPAPMGSPGLPEDVRQGRDGLSSLLDDIPDDADAACYVGDEDLERSLRALGALLPTADELEWAARGGLELLFPWGNDLSLYRRARRSNWDAPELDWILPRTDEARWPATNRFGLRALGGASVWCTLADGSLDAWSGAGEMWPWQGSGEWLVAVSGWVCGSSQRSHALRPVLPIGARARAAHPPLRTSPA